MLLLCITGLPLIFHEEIDGILHEQGQGGGCAGGYAESRSGPHRGERARPRRQARVIHFLIWDSTTSPERVWLLSVGQVDRSRSDDQPPRAGRRPYGRSTSTPPISPGDFTYIMFKLHVDMFAGLPEKFFLGLMGILFCVAIVSGVVVYAPSMRKLRFGTYAARSRASGALARSAQSRRHRPRRCGRWWSASPASSTHGPIVIKVWQYGQLAEMTAAAATGRCRHEPSSVEAAGILRAASSRT